MAAVTVKRTGPQPSSTEGPLREAMSTVSVMTAMSERTCVFSNQPSAEGQKSWTPPSGPSWEQPWRKDWYSGDGGVLLMCPVGRQRTA